MKTNKLKYNITISTAPTMPKLGKGSKRLRIYTLPFIVKVLTFAP